LDPVRWGLVGKAAAAIFLPGHRIRVLEPASGYFPDLGTTQALERRERTVLSPSSSTTSKKERR